MKILFVNFIQFWGGGESWTYQVMDELRARNHSIILLSNTQSELRIKAEKNFFETYPFKINKLSFLNFYQLSKIQKQIKEIKPDVIVLHSSLELKTVGLILKSSGCSKVFFTRGIPSPMRMKPLKRYLFSNVVTNVIVNSNYVKASVTNIAKLLKTEPEVIYHGINPITSIEAKGGTKNIAIIGRLSHEKGVDIALDVMKKVLKSELDARLWIIGDGKEKDNLVRLSNELEIKTSVNFLGFSNKVEELLLQCSILILPSRWEGFGLVLLEAMKLKIPCIAFDHTAANEIIINNVTGFLIPNMDIVLMAEKINYLLKNPAIAIDMGKNGHKHLMNKFTIEKSIDQYVKLMEGI
ncbi:MAG: glycosyltransferase family 4 protein [Paludibacter sp.]